MTDPGVMLVTGGSRGIGAATCRLAARRGWRLAVGFASHETDAAETVDACRSAGAEALAVRADVTSETQVEAMFATIDERFGRIDALVNDAGILHPQMRFDEMSAERWREVFEVNVIGAFLCARAAVRRMSTRHGGRGGTIVNVSSAAAYLGSPNEYVDYAATKGAIDTMTIGLGREVAEEGIRVNAVRPGLIETGIHASGGEPGRVARLAPSVPMRRGGRPEEVAETILWLASPASSYVTATTLDCSGGR